MQTDTGWLSCNTTQYQSFLLCVYVFSRCFSLNPLIASAMCNNRMQLINTYIFPLSQIAANSKWKLKNVCIQDGKQLKSTMAIKLHAIRHAIYVTFRLDRNMLCSLPFLFYFLLFSIIFFIQIWLIKFALNCEADRIAGHILLIYSP